MENAAARSGKQSSRPGRRTPVCNLGAGSPPASPCHAARMQHGPRRDLRGAVRGGGPWSPQRPGPLLPPCRSPLYKMAGPSGRISSARAAASPRGAGGSSCQHALGSAACARRGREGAGRGRAGQSGEKGVGLGSCGSPSFAPRGASPAAHPVALLAPGAPAWKGGTGEPPKERG